MIIQQVSLICGARLSNWRLNCWSCRTVVTVVPVERLAASKLGGEIGWSSELWWESRGRSPRLWTSSPKNQQCHLTVSLSPFSWSSLPFNAKNLKSSCISHVDRMPTLLPKNNTNKPRNECISNKRWMVWAKQVGQMSPNCTKNWGSSTWMNKCTTQKLCNGIVTVFC